MLVHILLATIQRNKGTDYKLINSIYSRTSINTFLSIESAVGIRIGYKYNSLDIARSMYSDKFFYYSGNTCKEIDVDTLINNVKNFNTGDLFPKDS